MKFNHLFISFLAATLVLQAPAFALETSTRYFENRVPNENFRCINSISAAHLVAKNGLATCELSYGVSGLNEEQYAGTFSAKQTYESREVCHGEGCAVYAAAVIFTGGLMLGRIFAIKGGNRKAVKAASQISLQACKSKFEELSSLLCEGAQVAGEESFKKLKP